VGGAVGGDAEVAPVAEIHRGVAEGAADAAEQGLTLVHFSAQGECFLWTGGAVVGCFEGVQEMLAGVMGCLGVI
jgi:hypothetical protein